MPYAKRVRKLQRLLQWPVIVSNPYDISYYTGYKPGADDATILLIPHQGKPTLCLDSLASFSSRHTHSDHLTKEAIADFPLALGYDETHLPAGVFMTIAKNRTMNRASNVIRKPREIKEPHEIDQMKKAIALNKKALEKVHIFGKRESDVAWEIEHFFHAQKAERSFETIVASGSNAGDRIHHIPGTKRTSKNTMTIVDFGSRVNGYSSDITRTYYNRHDKKQQTLADLIRQLQAECIDMIRPGVEMKEINDYHARLLEKLRFPARHSIGHGIGLFVHESATCLEKNMIITIEPGMYVPGFGGCRIEDMILVGKKPLVLSKKIPQQE